jgi:hypothetical protein
VLLVLDNGPKAAAQPDANAGTVRLRKGLADLAATPDEDVLAGGSLRLAVESTLRLSAEVSDAELRAINEHAHVALTKDQVRVFTDYAIHNKRLVTRPLQFTTAALEAMAEQAKAGRSILHNHRTGEPLGSSFDAEVVRETVRGVEADWVRIKWFGVVSDDTSPERRQRLLDCATGVYRFGSVGVSGGKRKVKDVETPDGWDYWLEIDADDTLLLEEYSRVHMGAAQGAGDMKFTADGTGAAAKDGLNGPDSPVRTLSGTPASDLIFLS